MKINLAATYALGCYLQKDVFDKADKMNIELSSTHNVFRCVRDAFRNNVVQPEECDILESFYYIADWQKELIPRFHNFMLDSGAFTFINGIVKSKCDFRDYTKHYANFINKYHVKNFFELDIEKVVGWNEYEYLRKYLEDRTGIDPIPVFHRTRGKDWYLNAIREHKKIAIGGFVIKEIKPSDYNLVPWLINEAHKVGCWIHGLGFTNLSWLPRLHWDSVDSSAWLYGNRSGVVYRFDGKSISKIEKPENTRLKAREVAVHNFVEWVKFGHYAWTHL